MRLLISRILIAGCWIFLMTSCTATPEEPPSISHHASVIETSTASETIDPIKLAEDSKKAAYREPYYVPQEEWVGLETRAYPELDSQAGIYISKHPNGNPDYGQGESRTIDSTRITVSTNQKKYSIAQNDEILVTVSFLTSDTSLSKYEKISVSRYMNLERWNDGSWGRMLYYVASFQISAAQGPHTVYVGETHEKTFSLQSVITQLTPGQYRMVVYVNSTPVYAEFELTE